jgi:cytochrome P450
MADFASVYPATVFLHSLGLPIEHAPQLVTWVRTIFDSLRHPDLASSLASAMGEVRAYFDDALHRRRRAEGNPDRDFLTHLLRSEIDGRPLREEEILTMCVVLTMAGVETTASQLGYMFHYLAEHPEKRRRIIDEPEIITAAVEEFLRVHPIVLPGRKVTRDIDFHGCPMRRGDMVMLPLPAANRAPATDEHPAEVDFDRRPNRHIAFGLGPHRCLGIHLARRELATALQVWHEIIPDYHLDGDQPLLERGGQLGLMTLPLAWDRRRRRPLQS